MSKGMPIVGLVFSGLIGILFLADLAAGFPFGRKSIALDAGFVVGSLILCYLSYSLLAKARG